MKNVTRCKITLSNGQRYTLRDPEDIGGVGQQPHGIIRLQ